MFVLDTNVISELRKAKAGKADPGVVRWAESVPVGALFLSAISVLELETGILLLERRDARQGRVLREWFDVNVLPAFSGRILPVDCAVALQCARLHIADRRAERDALIAATAMVHAMTIVTRNVADFTPTGVAILNPWSQ